MMMYCCPQLIKVDNTSGPYHHRWDQAYILRRTQCGLDGDFDHEIYKPAELSFQIRKGTNYFTK